MKSIGAILAIALFFVLLYSFGTTTEQALAFFNLLAGLLLVASVLFFLGGFVLYLLRLGTYPTYREDAIEYMRWGVVILFVLIVILAVQQFLLKHLMVAEVIVGILIIWFLIWLYQKAQKSGEKKEEHH